MTSHQGTNYTYNIAGRIKTMAYPSGAVVTYNYDGAGQVNQVLLDWNGIQTTLADNITYTPFGPVNSLSYGNGTLLSQSFDTAYRHTHQNTAGILALDYTAYDGNSNLLTKTDILTTQTSTFVYDELNRLDIASGVFGTPDYGYDRNGNRTSLSNATAADLLTYTANSNRMNTYNGTVIPLDPNGNTLALRGMTLGYNSFNRLIDINNASTTYQYNGLGQRISKNTGTPQMGQTGDANNDGFINPADSTAILNQILGISTAPGIADCNQDTNINVLDLVCLNNLINAGTGSGTSTVTFSYSLDGQLLGEYDNTGNALNEYVYLNGQPLALLNSSNIHYIHNDYLGAPTKLTNAAGAVVWSASYDPFGRASVNNDVDGDGTKVTLNLRFPGQYYDGETGLHYNYFRYYDPATGRYITSDPIGLQGGLNTYSYALNNPVGLYDPLGLWVPPSFPDWFVNGVTGFGDGVSTILTLGTYNTADLRNDLDIDGGVDECSALYKGGKYAGYAWGAGTIWAGGLVGGSNSVFWSGEGVSVRAAQYGATIGKTPIGSVLTKFGEKVPYVVWKAASATFAGNARGTAIKVGAKSGNIWKTIEQPILNWRNINIKNIP